MDDHDRDTPADLADELARTQAFLRERFGPGVERVERLRGGEWSRAYAFEREGAAYVVRFGAHREDFEKDRLAARYALPNLPIPAVVEIGETAGRFFAVSERVPGGFVDDLDGAEMRALLPALFAMSDAMRRVDLSATTGYGGWGADGQAPFASWRDYLLCFEDDEAGRVGGWRARLAASPTGSGPFDEAYAVLAELAAYAPDERHLIHSDLLNRNLLVEGGRISGVIDWGCGLYGDVLYDLAWFAYYAPWYPAWAGIDFKDEAARHFAAIGLDVPCFAERFRACQIHIGLGDQAYNAFKERWLNIAVAAQRTLAVAHGG